MNQEDEKVVEAMENYGGSFVRAIAHAARLADRENLERIKTAFSDYWNQYLKQFVRAD